MNWLTSNVVHLPKLIQDLALILGAAGLVTLLFKKMGQPVVLGYIIAGILVGPHFPVFPTITEASSIQIWAEIGVIFLLFALGLEFSFKKLARVGHAASVTAVLEVVTMVLIGFFTGRLFGWNNMDSLFLGGILAISSTTIIIRAFDELGVKGRGFVHLVFGILIVEDVVAILLMVLLSTVAISQTFSGVEMISSSLKLLFFLTLWFLLGIFLLPTQLRRLRPYMNEETLLVMSIGLCLFMVVLATKAGFSPALGAFMMGSILAETSEGEKIEHLVRPVKDLFAAVFFVSIGMLIDPKILWQYGVPVLIITVITIVGKTLSTLIGALVSGRSLKHAVQAGLSLAQIGEFSFIIATLGLSLKVTSDFLYPVAVGVSALTTFTTPYMIKGADRVYQITVQTLPARWLEALARYSEARRSLSNRSEWQGLIRAYALKVVVNSVMIAAIFVAVDQYLSPILAFQFNDYKLVNGIGLLASLVLSAPFLWALVLRRIRFQSVGNLWRNPRYRGVLLGLEISRWIFAFFLFGVVATRFITAESAATFSMGLTALLLLLFSRRLSGVYSWLENRFITNLSAKIDSEDTEREMPQLAPWDAHLVRLDIRADSPVIGKSLIELGIRENYGVSVALIERGQKKIVAPTREERLFPFDRVAVIGTDEQIVKFKNFIDHVEESSSADGTDFSYALHPVPIAKQSPFCGRSIRESGIREESQGLVVGVERGGQRILNPDSQLTIEAGDLLWIVGNVKLIKQLTTLS